MQLHKICIVGGGSAGWMTASVLAKHFDNTKEIVLIESPTTPRIGVGEATTQFFNTFVRYLGLKDEDWMPKCDATYKHSVRFENFNPNGVFHYPFGKTEGPASIADYYTWRKFGKIDSMTFGLIYSDTVRGAENGKLIPDLTYFNVGYHFDAIAFAEYLKHNYAIPKGVKLIEDTVSEIESCVDGISRVRVHSGDWHDADLFIDCTGFAAILSNEVGSEWEAWNSDVCGVDELMCDSAWTTRVPYKDKEKELVAYTNCTGMSSGWVWRAPTWSRIGTGYVFSSRHQSKEDALTEFKQHLGVGDEQEFRFLEFPTGVRKEIWKKNVVSIGLAGGFIEPLESGGLYSVHEFLFNLIQVLPKERNNYNGFIREQFNWGSKRRLKSFKDFVLAHYCLSPRDDTPFWKHYNQMNFESEFPDVLTQRFEQIGNLNYLSEGALYLLGGYEYDIIPDRFDVIAAHDGYESPDFDDMFMDHLTKRDPDYPTPLEYYQSTLYKKEDS